MSGTGWLEIKVVLVSGRGGELEPPPGRRMLVSSGHRLSELAEAIDAVFGRWDLSHLHLFELPTARFVLGGDDDPSTRDSESAFLGDLELTPGQAFEYVFDLGDDWRHHCSVERVGVDPTDEFYGPPPDRPVAIDGWGWLPDQYDRVREDPEGDKD